MKNKPEGYWLNVFNRTCRLIDAGIPSDEAHEIAKLAEDEAQPQLQISLSHGPTDKLRPEPDNLRRTMTVSARVDPEIANGRFATFRSTDGHYLAIDPAR